MQDCQIIAPATPTTRERASCRRPADAEAAGVALRILPHFVQREARSNLDVIVSYLDTTWVPGQNSVGPGDDFIWAGLVGLSFTFPFSHLGPPLFLNASGGSRHSSTFPTSTSSRGWWGVIPRGIRGRRCPSPGRAFHDWPSSRRRRPPQMVQAKLPFIGQDPCEPQPPSAASAFRRAGPNEAPGGPAVGRWLSLSSHAGSGRWNRPRDEGHFPGREGFGRLNNAGRRTTSEPTSSCRRLSFPAFLSFMGWVPGRATYCAMIRQLRGGVWNNLPRTIRHRCRLRALPRYGVAYPTRLQAHSGSGR